MMMGRHQRRSLPRVVVFVVVDHTIHLLSSGHYKEQTPRDRGPSNIFTSSLKILNKGIRGG